MVLLLPQLDTALPVVEVQPKAGSRSPSPPPQTKDISDSIGLRKDENENLRVPDVSSKKETPSYLITEIPAKGNGMISTRKIFPGEIIMSEAPLIVVPDEIFEDREKTEEFLDKEVNKLSAEQIAQFLSLTDCRTPENPCYLGIFYTNDMNYDGDAALLPLMARVNHSCKANAEFISRVDLGVQRLVANYTIEKGEEITINYMPISGEGSDVRDARQEYLLEWYGFLCTCVVCTLQDEEMEKDEALREIIKELQAPGINNLNVEELETLLDRLFEINGKPSYSLDILDLIYRKTRGGLERYLQGVRGLCLAITVHGEDSTWERFWRPRTNLDELDLAEIGGVWPIQFLSEYAESMDDDQGGPEEDL